MTSRQPQATGAGSLSVIGRLESRDESRTKDARGKKRRQDTKDHREELAWLGRQPPSMSLAAAHCSAMEPGMPGCLEAAGSGQWEQAQEDGSGLAGAQGATGGAEVTVLVGSVGRSVAGALVSIVAALCACLLDTYRRPSRCDDARGCLKLQGPLFFHLGCLRLQAFPRSTKLRAYCWRMTSKGEQRTGPPRGCGRMADQDRWCRSANPLQMAGVRGGRA